MFRPEGLDGSMRFLLDSVFVMKNGDAVTRGQKSSLRSRVAGAGFADPHWTHDLMVFTSVSMYFVL